MLKKLDHYLREFCSLTNRDKTRNYKGISLDGAPHQPVILLVILDLYACDPLRRNFIELDSLLLELWAIYKELLGITTGSSAAMPIYALLRKTFWKLVPKPGTPAPVERVRTSKTFYNYFLGVFLEDDLHRELQNYESRTHLREAMIKTYFPAERWLSISQSPKRFVNNDLATSAYAQRLFIDPKFGTASRVAEDAQQYRTLRDSSFRKVVTLAYDYRCALCGVRLRDSFNKRLLVEAAHIIPWSKTHDDRPVNGLCLCPLCHWAFDNRMLAVDLNRNILTNPKIQHGDNLPGHLATLNRRHIFEPSEERFLPDDTCLKRQLAEFHSA